MHTIPIISIIHIIHTIHMKCNYHTYHTYNSIHTIAYIQYQPLMPYIPYLPYIPNIPYFPNMPYQTDHTHHTYPPYHTTPPPHHRGGRGTVPHPHHTTGGGGGRSHMGPVYGTHPIWGGRGGGRAWCINKDSNQWIFPSFPKLFGPYVTKVATLVFAAKKSSQMNTFCLFYQCFCYLYSLTTKSLNRCENMEVFAVFDWNCNIFEANGQDRGKYLTSQMRVSSFWAVLRFQSHLTC